MIRVQVDKTIRDLKKGFDFLSKDQLAKATSQAINQTLLLGRTVARREVKKVYNIPQKNLGGINITKSTARFLQGNIYASSKPIPMDAFSPKFDIVSGGKVRGTQIISRRGIVKVALAKNKKQSLGVSIEVKKGDRVVVPYAFLLPESKPRVFARGEYHKGNGSYGFIQRHTRDENSSGNDSVKPMISITVFGAVVNPLVKQQIANKVETGFKDNMLKALKRQANML